MYLSREEFFKYRVERVKEVASLYDLLDAAGHPPRFEDRSAQMQCCFTGSHQKGKDNKPSARYYPAGERDDYETYYCFYCTPRPLDVIGFVQRQHGSKFMDALRYLERQYSIRYDGIEVAKDITQELDQLSKAVRHADPRRMLRNCEAYLRRNRDRYTMKQFLGLGYMLDIIHYRDDENHPAKTLSRCSKWKDKAKSLRAQKELPDAF